MACLQSLQTLGFRGEALSSLCAMSELAITTRQAGQETATKLEFDSHGALLRTSPAARSVGTTVALKNLFARLPVRYKARGLPRCGFPASCWKMQGSCGRLCSFQQEQSPGGGLCLRKCCLIAAGRHALLQEFKRNAKKEFARLATVLQAYALIRTGVRIICTHQASRWRQPALTPTWPCLHAAAVCFATGITLQRHVCTPSLRSAGRHHKAWRTRSCRFCLSPQNRMSGVAAVPRC